MANIPIPRAPTSIPTGPSVVPLNAARRTNAIRGPLWATLVRLSLDRVRSDLDEFLQKLDDSLFDLSGLDGTKGAAAAPYYFDSLRALRKQRTQVVDTVLNRIGEAWGRCEQSAPAAVEPARMSSTAPALGLPGGFTELSLLENEVLEESLAIAGAVQHVEGLVKADLLALQHRLAVLKGGVDPESVDVPITPAVVLSAFRAGLDEIEMLTTEIKLIIYKLFERQVLARIPSLYQALNEALVQAGILGDWRAPSPVARTFARNPAPASAGAGTGAAGHEHAAARQNPAAQNHAAGHHQAAPQAPHPAYAQAADPGWAPGGMDDSALATHPLWSILSQWMGPVAPPNPGHVPPSHPEAPAFPPAGFARADRAQLSHLAHANPADPQAVLEVLRDLLTPWRQASGHATPGGPGGGGQVEALGVPRDEILSALSWVRSMRQAGMMGVAPQAGFDPATPGMSAIHLKEQIQEVLKTQAQGKPTSSPTSTSLGIHEDVIDMVGFLFEFVMSDSQLAPSLQADLGRLQLPYVRMALVEPDLFAKPDHPARLLLNALSEAGKGLAEGATDEISVAVSGRIHTTIAAIADEHDPERAQFEAELESFQGFIAGTRRRSQIMERRLTETSAGQERKAASLRAVAAHVMPFVREGNFPHWLSLMLLRSWSNALMLMHLKEGDASQGFANGLAWMRDVRTLGQFPQGAEALRRVESSWPVLHRTWVQALSLTGVPPEEGERTSVALHRWLVNRATPGTATDQGSKTAEQAMQEAELEQQAAARPVPTPELPRSPSAPAGTSAVAKPPSPPSSAPSRPAPVLPPEIAALGVGSWVEFLEPAPLRGKLVYVSPFTQRLLFVGTNGAKLKEISRVDLAQAWSAGRVALVPDAPLFERALGSVVRRLGEFKAKEAPAPTAAVRPRSP